MAQHLYRHPKHSFLGKPLTWLCNHTTLRHLRRAVFSRLPFFRLQSDVTEVVYLNWLAETERVKHLCPKEVTLIDIEGKTLLSVLTYRHGHFRPTVFNWLKKLFPSPLQSNWRLYVDTVDGRTQYGAVLFIKNVMNHWFFTLGTRLFSDAMHTHLPLRFRHEASHYTEIDSGMSNSPDLHAVFVETDHWNLPEALCSHFGSEEDVLAYLCLQDMAFTDIHDADGICQAKIDLPIDLSRVIPLTVTQCESAWLADIIAEQPPFAFAVPDVPFKILDETVILSEKEDCTRQP